MRASEFVRMCVGCGAACHIRGQSFSFQSGLVIELRCSGVQV